MGRVIIGALLACSLCLPAQAMTIGDGLQGQFWDQGANSIANARNIVNAGAADATFIATALDYPNGGALDVLNQSTLVTDFLTGGSNNYLGPDPSVLNSVFLFTGRIALGAGEHQFQIGSDDGFELLVGGELVASADGLRPFTTTLGAFDAGAGGEFNFELLYYDGLASHSGLEARVDQMIIDSSITAPSAVPIGPSAVLFAGALAGLASMRVRRRRGA